MHSTDAVYCNRCLDVPWSVFLSFRLLITTVSPAKSNEPIAIPFEHELSELKEPRIRWKSAFSHGNIYYEGCVSDIQGQFKDCRQSM